jgi:LysM repeat protein
VRSGDTLAQIADRTGVPVDRLVSLNPSVDPQGLVSGQRIKLRE